MDVVAIDLEIAIIGLGFALVSHVEDERVVLVHLPRGMDAQVALQRDRVTCEEQRVFLEVAEEDLVVLAEGMGDHDLATHGVHHYEHAVLAVVQRADFQLSDFVGQADGEGGRFIFSVDFIQGDAARGLEAIVAAKQWGVFLLAGSQGHKGANDK